MNVAFTHAMSMWSSVWIFLCRIMLLYCNRKKYKPMLMNKRIAKTQFKLAEGNCVFPLVLSVFCQSFGTKNKRDIV